MRKLGSWLRQHLHLPARSKTPAAETRDLRLTIETPLPKKHSRGRIRTRVVIVSHRRPKS